MKTYLHLVLLLVLVSFVSCVDVPIDAPVSKSESGCFYVKTESGIFDVSFLKFEFEGHSYIRFGRNEYQTIVHDPNCACHQKDGTVVVVPDYSQPSEYLY